MGPGITQKSDSIFSQTEQRIRTGQRVLFSALTFILLILMSSGQLPAQQTGSSDISKGNVDEKKPINDYALFREEDFVPLDLQSESKKYIYPEVVLEDFETSTYTKKNLSFNSLIHRFADVAMRNDYPAPIKGSKRYLGVKVFGVREDAVQIYPPKPIIIDGQVERFSIWAYGKNLTGSLYAVVKDVNDNTHLVFFGLLNYRGWRRLNAPVPKQVLQQDPIITSKRRTLRVISFVFNPGTYGTEGKLNFLYLDDFSAIIKSKYTDRQSDDW